MPRLLAAHVGAWMNHKTSGGGDQVMKELWESGKSDRKKS